MNERRSVLLLVLVAATAILAVAGLLTTQAALPSASPSSSTSESASAPGASRTPSTPPAAGSSGASASAPGSASHASTPPASSAAPSSSPSTTAAQRAFDPARVSVSLRSVAAGFDQPVFVTGSGDRSGRLFVVEQSGRIRIIQAGSVLSRPFLDVTSLIACCGERGLLGLAFHPDFGRDGRFYVDYTDDSTDHNLTVAEYRRRSSDPDVADPASARVLLRVPHGQFGNHNAGMVAFGPDGMLYVATGDGGGAGGSVGASQKLDSLLAKLLRIDVDHPGSGTAYAIPADNPFVHRQGARGEVWAWGLRNPWRFSFDRQTGDLWIGDVGQGAWEEIDHAARGVGGQDYGWNVMEGRHCYSPPSGCRTDGLTLPIAEYGHDQGCAVVGGYVYRGSAFEVLRGAYLLSDNCSGRIWSLDAAASGAQAPVTLLDTSRSISSFGQDDAGELYVADLSGGEILEIAATPR